MPVVHMCSCQLLAVAMTDMQRTLGRECLWEMYAEYVDGMFEIHVPGTIERAPCWQERDVDRKC